MTPKHFKRAFVPWQEVMAFGLGVLRLPVEAFWAMTLRELEAAACGVFGPPSLWAALTRRDLSQLMGTYPDQNQEDK